MKNKPTSPKLSVVDSAWQAFFEEQASGSLEKWNDEGWKTAEQVASEMKVSRPAVVSMLNRRSDIETRQIRAYLGGANRKVNIYRPKVQG